MLNRRSLPVVGLSLVLGALFLPLDATASILGPTPYLSFANSPFAPQSFSWFYLENFEDGLFNTPGVSVDNGLVSTAGFFANDSVDADDGTIDGLGVAGNNMYNLQGTNLVNLFTFTFDANVLGNLPTHAGIVWTDGAPNGRVTFEAFDENGNSLGNSSANLGDSSFFGTTAEDRFFGASNPGGISKIFITDNGAPQDVDVDHLQYGFASTAVPEPVSLLVWGALGLIGMSATRRRR